MRNVAPSSQLLREQGPAFPSDFRRSALAGDLQRDYQGQDKATLESANERFSVAGRLIRNRGAFLLIQDGSGTIQLYLNRENSCLMRPCQAIKWDLGDIVAASGALNRSGKGDLYINMEEGRLLTKALRPLPDKYHGLVDQEMRYRQRYVDLIVNPEVREISVSALRLSSSFASSWPSVNSLKSKRRCCIRLLAVRRRVPSSHTTTPWIWKCISRWRRALSKATDGYGGWTRESL